MPKNKYEIRYNTWHIELNGNTLFYLEERELDKQEARWILLKIIQRARRDLVNYAFSEIPVHQEIWESARSFLFDDDHYISWGDCEYSLKEITQILGLDLEWARKTLAEQVRKKVRRRQNGPEKERNRNPS